MESFKKSQLISRSKALENINSIMPSIDELQRSQEIPREILESFKQKEINEKKEELRRHNELVNSIKMAGEMGATINIGNDANGIQIQQNAANSQQSFTNSQESNYEEILDVLKEIEGYFDLPQFLKTFGDDSAVFKKIVEDTIVDVENKKEPKLINKSLNLLKNISIRVGSSLISTGILALLNDLQ